MKRKTISIKDLESNLMDGLTIDEMLSSREDCLLATELGSKCYNRAQDQELNRDFRNYRNKEIVKFRAKSING